jgi:hypothetical protein
MCWKRWNEYVGFEVLTAVVVKSAIFWDITPYTVGISQKTVLFME